jgi:hypothetical protein
MQPIKVGDSALNGQTESGENAQILTLLKQAFLDRWHGEREDARHVGAFDYWYPNASAIGAFDDHDLALKECSPGHRGADVLGVRDFFVRRAVR